MDFFQWFRNVLAIFTANAITITNTWVRKECKINKQSGSKAWSFWKPIQTATTQFGDKNVQIPKVMFNNQSFSSYILCND